MMATMSAQPMEPSRPRLKMPLIVRRLRRAYGSPRHGNKEDPLDELVYIVLSTRTRQAAAEAVFQLLRATYPSWDDMARARPSRTAALIQHLGLGNVKAAQLASSLVRLRTVFGSCTLEPLRDWSALDVEAFLTQLPGVSRKVAKCIMMYSLGQAVLPVDVHVHRVASRLGLPVKKRPDTSQALIEAAIPGALRYDFHVNALAHGRECCRPRTPRCRECCVKEFCESYERETRRDVSPPHCS